MSREKLRLFLCPFLGQRKNFHFFAFSSLTKFMGVVISMRNQEHSNSNHEPTTDMNGYNNIAAIDSIPWKKAPSSDSGLRAFARRHGFYPRRTNSGMWAVCWSSTADAEEYPTAIEAIKAEVEYRRR